MIHQCHPPFCTAGGEPDCVELFSRSRPGGLNVTLTPPTISSRWLRAPSVRFFFHLVFILFILMLPPMVRLVATLATCALLPLSCLAFVVVPTGSSILSCSSVCRKAYVGAAGSQPRQRGSTNSSRNGGRGVPAPRRLIVLQVRQ